MAFERVGYYVERFWNFHLFEGSPPFSVGQLVISFAGLGLTFLVSRLVRRLLTRRVLIYGNLDGGTQFVVLRVIHYLVLAAGIAVILQTNHIDLSALTVFASVLGLGIGFGLQNIASNFVSGILLLFERPIKVGDFVSVGDTFGEVTEISIRSTRVTTADNVTMIIPNSDFVTNQVTNWSYGDPKIRLRVPVGVAYGSDTQLVSDLLYRAAREHPAVLTEPTPIVFFREFGDSSLNFELTAWIPTPNIRATVVSDLHFSIERLFREHGIEIPFPQRDVHVR